MGSATPGWVVLGCMRWSESQEASQCEVSFPSKQHGSSCFLISPGDGQRLGCLRKPALSFPSWFHFAFSPSNRLEQTGFSDRMLYQPSPEAVHEKDIEKEGLEV